MASAPETTLADGLAALKQGNYQDAIARFLDVCQSAVEEKSVLRAHMGLIVAYERTHNPEKAIALCQSLSQSSKPKVQQWATNTLIELEKRYPQLFKTENSSEVVTEFVPFKKTPHTSVSQEIFESLQSTPLPAETGISIEQAKQAEPKNSQPEHSEIIPQTSQSNWRQAGRVQQVRPLKPIKLNRLWFVQGVTAIALFWLIRHIVQFAMATTNGILVKLPFVEPIQIFYRDPTLALYFFFAILLCFSPWLIDKLLQLFYGLEFLPINQLSTQSPESAKVLRRFCVQKKKPIPTLGILPTSAPVAITYGNLPRNARIVVSLGLLEQLADDEIATIYASQLGHIFNWDFVFMSLIMLTLQLPYIAYWQSSQFADKIQLKIKHKQVNQIYYFGLSALFILAVAVSTLSYSLYWLLRLPTLWFSRLRIYYSDRIAAEVTGNPNGFTRALLKIAINITQDIQKQQSTSWLLEGFDLAMPLGYRQAITIGSCYPHIPCEKVLEWDCVNPYRNWLAINSSHPLTGDRLYIQNRYAQFWNIDTELDLLPTAPLPRTLLQRVGKLLDSYKGLPLLQSSLLFGLIFGLWLRAVFWSIAWIADWLNIWQVIWLHQMGSLTPACLLIGFSLSVFLQINGYFPDIKSATANTESALPNLLVNPDASPPDSQPVRFSGKLLGRRGVSNWLGQDLILETPTGLVRLHFLSRFGHIGNLLWRSLHPGNFIAQQITATGWFRRGVTPWIDLETLRTQGGGTSRADYPIWIVILACGSAIWGAYIIWQSTS